MAVIDWWPTQTGRIVDGLTIPCIAEGAILEGSAVKYGTSTSGQITVAAAAALGAGFGVAIRYAAATGDPVPVMVHGLYKMIRSNTTTAITQGHFVMNSTTVYVTDVAGAGTYTVANLLMVKGTSYILGLAMQSAATTLDSIVILIGRSA